MSSHYSKDLLAVPVEAGNPAFVRGLARELEAVEEVAEKMSSRVIELEQAIRAVCRGKVPVALLRELVEVVPA